ncbi:MAG: cysteine methyltransferase [Planctomycetota bacterium]|nr:MAG: cysteine methyltransferase [Planctomycetota bacterium]
MQLDSPIGELVVAAVERGVCLLEFADPRRLARQMRALTQHLGVAPVDGPHAHTEQLARELGAYFAGELQRFEVPLALAGTPFQESVWEQLRSIPFGGTISYAELARRIERPTAQRAVAGANAANRLAIVVPCHRVVASDGTLGGYGGGLWRKRELLALEGAAPAR